MWETTRDLLEDIYSARKAFKTTGNVDAVHAECRIFNAAIKVVEIGMEHARLTNRLANTGIPSVAIASQKSEECDVQ